LKRRGRGMGGYIKRAVALMISAAVIFGLCAAAAFELPQLLVKAASLSAALAMPEAVIEELKNRFADEVALPDPQIEAKKQPRYALPPKAEPSVEAVLPKPTEPKNEITEQGNEPLQPPKKEPVPEIPQQYRGRVLTEDMSDSEGVIAIKIENFRLRNYTPIPAAEIKAITEQSSPIMLTDTAEPQVLIYHTHATESYCPYDDGFYDTRYNWRSTDNNNNMVAVGAVMADTLRENGIAVIQDTQQHDYPSYDGSYANSYRSIKDNLEAYPTIKVILDIHRDAIERESGLIIKPAIEHEGQRYAQLMLVSNCDDGSGLLPNWRENLRFAAAYSRELERMVPNITRPILFSYRKYNQQLCNGALLLEFGTHANTLEEAQRTARVAGQALANALKNKEAG